MFKDKMVNAYKRSSEQLKKGNPKGYEIIDGVLKSLTILTDDKEIIFQQQVVATISAKFLESQKEIEGGKKFLKDLGVTLEEIGKANESDNVPALNQHLRDFVFLINQRWKESSILSKVE